MPTIHFSANLQKYRKLRHMSQEELAEKLQVTRQAVAKWESGANYPDILNLTMLAGLFGVTVDALIYGIDCPGSGSLSDTGGEGDRGIRQAVDFLLRAKRQTYAGNGGEEKEPCRPGAHDFRYEEEDYFYMDTYLGGRLFTGEEAVWQKQEKAAVPIWSMNYSGRTLADSFDTGFLKEALGLVDEKKPFRGPALYRKGEYLYHCSSCGSLEWFQGQEEIYYGTVKIYECVFHGGAVA